jgi:predicted ATPase
MSSSSVLQPGSFASGLLAGRYRLEAELGQGGMGKLYRGLDIQTGEAVAVKALKPEIVAGNPELVARFVREGEALRRLNHPNIVKMVDALEWEGERYLVMEYVPGGDLEHLLAEEGPLPIERSLSVALDLADALTRAHHIQVIHRDIKPANILLATDDTLRLADFGIARYSQGTSLTEHGSVMGSIAYLSPEACLGQELDERADIWSFGVLLYQMLLGQLPFEGESIAAVLTAVMGQELPDMQALRPDIPDGLADLVYRMLVKDREGRIPSARLVGAELEGLLKGFQVTPRHELSAYSTPKPDEREIRIVLPAQSSRFIGRKRELAEIDRLLGQPETRLLTLLGAGGMGKTRLGIEAARGQAKEFADGVCFVDLAPLSEPEHIPRAMAEALSFTLGSHGTPQEQILAYLRNKELLLLLDNFEPVVAGAPFLSELIDNSQRVKLLVTSRTRLNLQNEQVFEVGGMITPKDEAEIVFEEVEAVELFISYARRARPDYELEERDKTAVVQICRLVEGMPLGIQHAAAWVHTLPPDAIAEELASDLDFLASGLLDIPDRQRSMRAVFDYSWKLLTEPQKEIFLRCSVFRGGFTREAAKAVAGAAVRSLSILVAQSMLQRAPEGRFHVHELMRQFGEEVLRDSVLETAVRDAHAAYYLGRVVEKKGDLQGGDQVGALRDIARDFENVHTSWYWAVSRKNEQLLLPTLECLHLFCNMRSLLKIEEELFQAAMAQFEREDTLLSCLLLCYYESARSHYAASPDSVSRLEQAVESIRNFGDPAAEAMALDVLGRVRVQLALNDQETLEIYEQSLQIYEELGDVYNQARLMRYIGSCLFRMGDLEGAQPYSRQSLALRREINDLSGIADSMYAMSPEVDRQERLRHYEEIYNIFKQLDDRLMMAWSGVTVANAAIETGDMEKAKSFIDEGLQIVEEIYHPETNFWVLFVAAIYAMVEEDYQRVAEIVGLWEKLPINRPDMLIDIPILRVYLATVKGDLAQAREHARSLATYVGLTSNLDAWALYAFSLILEMEGRYELALEFITRGLINAGFFAPLPSTARILERIKSHLTEEAYQAAEERGKALDPAEGIRIMKEEGYL